jgi:hypothetical protein
MHNTHCIFVDQQPFERRRIKFETEAHVQSQAGGNVCAQLKIRDSSGMPVGTGDPADHHLCEISFFAGTEGHLGTATDLANALEALARRIRLAVDAVGLEPLDPDGHGVHNRP